VLVVAATAARAADPIQRVEVSLTVEGGEPHPLVVRRMVESIGSGAERLLLGRDSELVARQEATLAGVLREVLDRVIGGYRVTGLGFQTGTTTVVRVRVEPRGPVLGDLHVDVDLQGVHIDAQPLVRAVLEPTTVDLRRLGVRLPTKALEWAGPLLEQQTAEIVEAAAVGFTGRARIQPALSRLVVVVGPRDSRVIRDVGVRFRSTSIPSVLLADHGPHVASMAEPLRGLPVVFAAAHRARLEALLAQRLSAYPPVREFAIEARPVLQVAEVTYVTVLAESTLYRGRVEARLNFGTEAPPPDVRATLGRLFGSIEPFVEFTIVPSNLAFRTAVGIRLELGTHVSIGALTGFDEAGVAAFAAYRLSPDLEVRGRYALRTNALETTLSYRMNEYLSWEGVATSTGFIWLRLVSNL
jgi:hypothetical protein